MVVVGVVPSSAFERSTPAPRVLGLTRAEGPWIAACVQVCDGTYAAAMMRSFGAVTARSWMGTRYITRRRGWLRLDATFGYSVGVTAG